MSGGTVKSVSVVYQAFTDKFEKALDKTSGKMSGFVKKAAGIAAGFIAARATLGRFTKAMGDLDKLGKLSDSLEIDPNTLRGLDLAATQTGTSFEVMTKGIQRMVQTIGEARSGMSSGTLALKELGMTVEDFEGLNAEQQLMKMADAIAAIEDPAQKAAAANKLFGRSGKELLNVLNQGSAGMREFIKEAERVGGPISREEIKRVEEANDAMDKMGRAIEGVAQSIAINLSPALTDITNVMKGLIVSTRDFMALWSQDNLSNTILDLSADLEIAQAKMAAFLSGNDEHLAAKIWEIESKRDAAFLIELGEKVGESKKKGGIGGGNLMYAPELKKGFAESAAFQSSRAFDILNPAKPNSLAGKNAAANETTAKNTSSMKQRLEKLVGNRATVTIIPGG